MAELPWAHYKHVINSHVHVIRMLLVTCDAPYLVVNLIC